MRSTRGLLASLVFLLALPLTALYESLIGTGTGVVIHGALALGSALMSFAVFVLVADAQVTARILGIVAMTTVACVKAYAHGLTYQGTSLDEHAPILKVLWLLPFVWLLVESTLASGGMREGGQRRTS